MTFATEQVKRSTKKIIMARINPARDITHLVQSQYAPDSIYEFDFTYKIATLQQNGTFFTQVAVGATLNNNEFYHDETIGEVSFKTSTTPSTSNVIIVTYYLFFTDTNYVEARLTPSTSGLTDLFPWDPRIRNISSIGEDLSNSVYGILSISGGSIELSNADGYFNQYLSNDDSFRLRPIVIWQALTDASIASNCQQLFQGRVDKISLSDDSVSISYSTEIGKLKEQATMGDSAGELFFTKSAFPNINPLSEGQPIRMMFGTITKYKHVVDGSLVTGELVDPSTMYEAACTSYNASLSTSVNRVWGLCRVPSYGTENFGKSIDAVDNTDPTKTKLTLTYSDSKYKRFWHGMTFTITGGALTSYKVLSVQYFSAFTVNLWVTKDATLLAGDTIVTNDCPSLYFYRAGNNKYYPLNYSDHYTAATTITSGGNKYIYITLVNNVEALIDTVVAPINPDEDKIFFRVLPNQGANNNQRHGNVVKTLLESAGLSVETPTSPNSQLLSDANFSIPMFDESDYGSYFDYVEKILKSSFASLAQLLTGQIRYYLLTKLTTGQFNITDEDIIADSFNVDIDYNDVITSVVTYNPNYSDAENGGSSSISQSSTRAKYLHQTGNVLTFRNVLEEMTDPVNRILGCRAERFVNYEFETKQLNYLTTLGLSYTLRKNKLLGDDETRVVRILGINKSKNKTKIKASDFYNIPTLI